MRGRPRAEWAVVALFGSTCLAGLALLAVYILGGQAQVEGVLLAIALGGVGAGVVIWAQALMDTPVVIEERRPEATAPALRQDLALALDEEAGFSRRTLLVGMLVAAFGSLAAALAIPVFSLGPAPGEELRTTGWRQGRRLVDETGAPVHANDIALDGVVTVFPEGDVGSADSQTILIHVPAEMLRLSPDRAALAPMGYVAYSKICTHAGCPVGLYRAQDRHLVCPCHQSTFDVLAGAVPVSGPAARPLPQLPIRLAEDGTFIAEGDFPEPVGPGFWDLHR